MQPHQNNNSGSHLQCHHSVHYNACDSDSNIANKVSPSKYLAMIINVIIKHKEIEKH